MAFDSFHRRTLGSRNDGTGPRLEIVSPDVVELIILSSDPSVGGQIAASAGQFARRATTDRWQLVSDAVMRTESRWIAAE